MKATHELHETSPPHVDPDVLVVERSGYEKDPAGRFEFAGLHRRIGLGQQTFELQLHLRGSDQAPPLDQQPLGPAHTAAALIALPTTTNRGIEMGISQTPHSAVWASRP